MLFHKDAIVLADSGYFFSYHWNEEEFIGRSVLTGSMLLIESTGNDVFTVYAGVKDGWEKLRSVTGIMSVFGVISDYEDLKCRL